MSDKMIHDLEQEYRQRFEKLATYRDEVWKILTRDFFSRFVNPEHTVLDLGCGWGEFIRNIAANRKLAMDLNPDMPNRVGAGVETYLQDCSDAWPFEEASLDIVFTSNFFEHLPNKEALRLTLKEAQRCLKPGGRIICLGPNIRFLPGAYWDFWDHFVPLTEKSLEEGLQLAGFRTVVCKDRFLPYSMSQGFTPPLVMIKLFLRLPILWKFFGKQFLVIAEKA